jgi:N-dimethylarginine dimethylaminohydrolase
MFMNPVDLGKLLIYPAFCGWETIKWFRNRGFELIEIPEDEQRDFLPSNLMILEPGKIIMHAGAKETIRKVRKAGVEVIEVPYKECVNYGGGGIFCSTLQMIRDRGPKLEDMR